MTLTLTPPLQVIGELFAIVQYYHLLHSCMDTTVHFDRRFSVSMLLLRKVSLFLLCQTIYLEMTQIDLPVINNDRRVFNEVFSLE